MQALVRDDTDTCAGSGTCGSAVARHARLDGPLESATASRVQTGWSAGNAANDGSRSAASAARQ